VQSREKSIVLHDFFRSHLPSLMCEVSLSETNSCRARWLFDSSLQAFITTLIASPTTRLASAGDIGHSHLSLFIQCHPHNSLLPSITSQSFLLALASSTIYGYHVLSLSAHAIQLQPSLWNWLIISIDVELVDRVQLS
jgi:hypothetical protein